MSKAPKKTALITGCSKGGLGDALAREFHSKGIRVLATARNLSRIEHFKELGIETLKLDVEDSESIKAAAKAVEELTGGKLDFLLNNSGMGYSTTILDADMKRAKKMYNVNLFGMIEVTQAFAPQVIAAKGQIINTGSIVGMLPIPLQGTYNASKAAVHSLSDALRVEMAPFGVKVICIVTGGVKTPFFRNNADYHFPDDSPYKAAREVIEPILATRSTDEFTATPEQYARKVVRNSLGWWPSARLWAGGETTITWLLTTFFWHTALDPFMSRHMSMHKAAPLLNQPKKSVS